MRNLRRAFAAGAVFVTVAFAAAGPMKAETTWWFLGPLAAQTAHADSDFWN